LNALFVGGYLPQSDFAYGHSDGWAHVGKLSLNDNMWKWQKQMTETTQGNMFNVVTALALSPDD